MNSKAPPLSVWMWAAALFVAMQFALQYVPVFDRYGLAYFQYQLKLLEYEFERAKPNALKVVVIGSSLTHFGIVNDGDLSSYLKSELNSDVDRNVVLTRVHASGHRLQFLTENVNLFDRLLEHKPDVVLIQSEWLTVRFEGDIGNTNRTRLKGLIGTPFFFQYRPPVEFDPESYVLPERRIDSFAFQAYVHQSLKQLKRAGIEVFILDIPKPLEVDRQIHSGSLEIEFQKLLTRYLEEFGMPYWQYSGPEMGFDYFKDGGHMNMQGRETYTRWLVEKIVEEMD